MMHGEKVALRARHEQDVAVLHAELYDDVATRARADTRAWQPISPGTAASPFAIRDPDERTAYFSVLELRDDQLAGEALLWGIDTHNRAAHLGVALRPAFRGRGLGGDTVRVLCRYGFAIRGLHRLQIDTLADNPAMIHAAHRAGFVLEGTLRRSAWVNGGFADETILGLLAEDWPDGPTA